MEQTHPLHVETWVAESRTCLGQGLGAQHFSSGTLRGSVCGVPLDPQCQHGWLPICLLFKQSTAPCKNPCCKSLSHHFVPTRLPTRGSPSKQMAGPRIKQTFRAVEADIQALVGTQPKQLGGVYAGSCARFLPIWEPLSGSLGFQGGLGSMCRASRLRLGPGYVLALERELSRLRAENLRLRRRTPVAKQGTQRH